MSQTYKIVERLRNGRHEDTEFEDVKKVIPPTADELQAADLIQALGEALEPFAEASAHIDRRTPSLPDGFMIAGSRYNDGIEVGHLRRARSILSKLKETNNE